MGDVSGHYEPSVGRVCTLGDTAVSICSSHILCAMNYFIIAYGDNVLPAAVSRHIHGVGRAPVIGLVYFLCVYSSHFSVVSAHHQANPVSVHPCLFFILLDTEICKTWVTTIYETEMHCSNSGD